mgnify:CR=1 FL=1
MSGLRLAREKRVTSSATGGPEKAELGLLGEILGGVDVRGQQPGQAQQRGTPGGDERLEPCDVSHASLLRPVPADLPRAVAVPDTRPNAADRDPGGYVDHRVERVSWRVAPARNISMNTEGDICRTVVMKPQAEPLLTHQRPPPSVHIYSGSFRNMMLSSRLLLD